MEVNGYAIEPSTNLRRARLRDADLRGAKVSRTILEGLKL